MSCLDNTDILRIVGGNSFQIAITVKARRVSDGSEIEDFDLSASSPVLNLIHAGEKTRKYFVTQGNQAIISFDGSEGLGYYGMEMSGSYNSEAWRFCIEKVLQLVDTNAKANIPEWSVLVDDTYFVEGTISIYGGGGGGDTVQADWTETNPTSAAFILHKPDLSVYATKTEVASGLAGKQDTIVDLTSIRNGAAAGATAYQKPGTGIPESDMSEGVQSALDKAEDAYQLPSSGIPASDMSEGVQAALEKANSAVQTETDPVFSGSPAAEITQADINTWNAKQPAIADLADIREGAAAGATAVQPDEMAQAIDVVDGDIADINAKIPSVASSLNQLADKAYVNSSIATNSATYRGSFNLITDLGMNVDATHAQIAGALATAIVTADNNDYAFVQIPDSASTPTVIAKIERYKHNGSGWVYEYDLNNSGFTAAQWAAINSGITSGLVGKLADLPNNSELATMLNGKQNTISDLSAIRSGAAAGATAVQPADLTEALNDVEAEIAGLDESKQDTIEDLSTIRSGAAAGATAYQKPGTGIPESDMGEGVQTSLGKADSAYQKPANGIPATDMDAEVQAALEKANSAVQTETDPVFSNSPAAEISQTDINNWNAKQPAIGDLADIREGAAAGATAVQPDEMAQAIDEVDGDIADINAKIPSTASSLNQLADKAYVNSSIATNSATYRGSFNLISDLGMNVDATHAQIAGALATAIVTADNNDYAFVQIPDSASTPTVIAKIERYKHNGTGWVYEYDLNNSGFTAAQWAAINSGITSGLVGKLADLPNNSELVTLLNGKQNVISDLSAIRSGASAGATAYQKPSGGIPASDMSSTVQQDLSKANTAVQTETDPIFSASPAAGITAQNIQTWNGEPAARQAADAALQTTIQNEATARATADALLQQQYNALTQSDIIVGALPASGVPNVIYRVPGTTDFTDYMWYDNQFVPMATYGLPISAEFVVDNNQNKMQEEINGEVDAQINGSFEEQDLSEELTLLNNRGYVNYETGEVVTYNGFVVYGADVTGMPSIRISCSGPNSTTNKQGLAFYDANGTYIDGEIYERNTQEIREVDVPNSAAYVKVSISGAYTDPIKFYGMIASKGIVDDINDIKEELEALPSIFGSTDAITDPNSGKTQTAINAEVDEILNGGSGWIDESSSVEWTLGKNINGRYENYYYDWGSNSNQKASHYIPVTPGERVMITIPATTTAIQWYGIGYYDENKVAVDCGVTRIPDSTTANTPRDITIPAGVYYIRTTAWIDETTYGAFVYKKFGHIDGLVQRVAALEEGGDSAAKKYAGLKCVAIGDSHSNTNARSIWLGRITEKTGMVYLAELNSLIYFANTTPAAYEMYVNALLAQAQALVDNAPNYDEPDVIFVEEVHQRWDDTIGAKPFIPHNLIDLGYTKNNSREEYEYFEANATSILGAIASANRHEGSVLRSSVSTSQIVATFSALSVSAGNITITIGGVAHVISVTSGMTVKQVVDTVYIQAFGDDSDWSNTSKTDTTITFSWIGAGEATNNFVIDTGNTGVTITMGSISTTTVYVYRRYNQYDLTDWTDKTKWDSFGAWNLNQQNSNGTYGYWTNAYAAMGGVITLLQTHFPNAMIVWMALPNWGGPAAFNPAPRNAAELKASYAWTYDKASRDKFIEVGELYNLRTIDVECVSGISVANYSTFFTQGNVHPKDEGYERWGDVVANWI